eukprot:10904393-Prorocentrum_lima.AAC.1
MCASSLGLPTGVPCHSTRVAVLVTEAGAAKAASPVPMDLFWPDNCSDVEVEGVGGDGAEGGRHAAEGFMMAAAE